jgi:hypothetical protein
VDEVSHPETYIIVTLRVVTLHRRPGIIIHIIVKSFPMSTVLITGLNGFCAVHTALIYLAYGWNVRGTFRSQSKADKTLALPVWGDSVKQGKIEGVIVEDLVEGDFGKVLEGVEVVSPCIR